MHDARIDRLAANQTSRYSNGGDEMEAKQDNTLAGIEFLEQAMHFFNTREEACNDSKSPIELLQDYQDAIKANNGYYCVCSRCV